VHVGSDQYVPVSSLNGQDLVDIKEIKELERLANIRADQNITRDDEFLMEDDDYLIGTELKIKNEERWQHENRGIKLL